MKTLYCDKEKIITLLDGRSFVWLAKKIQQNGFEIKYRNLVAILNNINKNPAMIHCIAIANVLGVSPEEIFYIKE